MIELTLNNIETFKQDFKKILGEDFINTAENYNTIGLNVKKVEQINNTIHPFVKFWQVYNQNIKQTKSSGQLVLSWETMYLLDLLSNLMDVSKLKNGDRIINAIKGKNTFYSAVFETYIAAYYASIYQVEILLESKNKSPDLLIKKGKDKVYIECKSLEDFSLKRTPLLMNLIENIQSLLAANELSYKIAIMLTYPINTSNKDEILNVIKKLITEDRLNEYCDENLKIKVYFEKIGDWDVPTYGQQIMNFSHHPDMPFSMQGQFMSLSNGLIESKNIMCTSIFPLITLAFGFGIFKDFNFWSRENLSIEKAGRIGFIAVFLTLITIECLIITVLKVILFRKKPPKKTNEKKPPKPKEIPVQTNLQDIRDIYTEAASIMDELRSHPEETLPKEKSEQPFIGEDSLSEEKPLAGEKPFILNLPELKPLESEETFKKRESSGLPFLPDEDSLVSMDEEDSLSPDMLEESNGLDCMQRVHTLPKTTYPAACGGDVDL